MHLLRPAGTFEDLLAPYRDVDRRARRSPAWVLANMVGGLDGTAAVGGRVGVLSGGVDAELFRAMRALADVVLVGAETVRRERYGPVRLGEELRAGRVAEGRAPVPPLAVVSGSLAIDWTIPLFAEADDEARPVVITSDAAPAPRRAAVPPSVEVLEVGGGRVDLASALGVLAERTGRAHPVVLCEGGPTLLGELVVEDLLDELCLTLAPIAGGDPLPIMRASGDGVASFRLASLAGHEDTLFLRYERREGTP